MSNTQRPITGKLRVGHHGSLFYIKARWDAADNPDRLPLGFTPLTSYFEAHLDGAKKELVLKPVKTAATMRQGTVRGTRDMSTGEHYLRWGRALPGLPKFGPTLFDFKIDSHGTVRIDMDIDYTRATPYMPRSNKGTRAKQDQEELRLKPAGHDLSLRQLVAELNRRIRDQGDIRVNVEDDQTVVVSVLYT